eukprot:m.1323869 g.1323869  ORF g.1323869 m.1323869 type:complete len:138 (-) comp24851_c0_seq24:4501-4914(-)
MGTANARGLMPCRWKCRPSPVDTGTKSCDGRDDHVTRMAKRDKAGGSSLSEAESADGAMQPPRRTAPRPDSFGGSPTASSTKARPTSMTSPGPALPLGAKPALVPAGTTTADTDTKAGGVTSPGPPRPAGPKPPMRN